MHSVKNGSDHPGYLHIKVSDIASHYKELTRYVNCLANMQDFGQTVLMMISSPKHTHMWQDTFVCNNNNVLSLIKFFEDWKFAFYKVTSEWNKICNSRKKWIILIGNTLSTNQDIRPLFFI